MALKEITDHISKDAERKAVEITKEAEENSREILDEADKKVEAERERILADVAKRAEEERKRIVAMARLEARSAILTSKQNKVQAIFDEALRSLADLPEREYLEVLKNLLRKAAATGGEVILSPRDRKRINAQFVAEISPSLKLSGETRDIKGGFILKSGRIESNYSFEALVAATRNGIEAEVLRTLFAD